MKVYVTEYGCYSDRFIGDVFATPELAMASVDKVSKEGWKQKTVLGCREWWNGLDWSGACSILEKEVIEALE